MFRHTLGEVHHNVIVVLTGIVMGYHRFNKFAKIFLEEDVRLISHSTKYANQIKSRTVMKSINPHCLRYFPIFSHQSSHHHTTTTPTTQSTNTNKTALLSFIVSHTRCASSSRCLPECSPLTTVFISRRHVATSHQSTTLQYTSIASNGSIPEHHTQW